MGGNVSALIALTTVAALLAPVAEELLYRGFLLPSLSRAMPKAGAVSCCCVLGSARSGLPSQSAAKNTNRANSLHESAAAV